MAILRVLCLQSGCVAGCKVARIFHVPALASLACVQAKLGDMRAALRSIGLAISHDDINSVRKMDLGMSEPKGGTVLTQYITFFEFAAQDLVFVRAMLLRSTGRVREAVRDLSAALKRDRDNLPCRFLRALCLEELEQAEEDGAAGDSPADDTAAAGLSSSKDMRRAQQRDPMITDYASIDFNSPLFDPFFRRYDSGRGWRRRRRDLRLAQIIPSPRKLPALASASHCAAHPSGAAGGPASITATAQLEGTAAVVAGRASRAAGRRSCTCPRCGRGSRCQEPAA